MSSKVHQVHIFQNRIPEYRVPFFLQLIRNSSNRDVDVKILISSKPYQNRGDEAARFVPHEVIKTKSLRIGKLNFDIFLPKLKLLDAELYVVEFGIRNLLQILFLKIFGRGHLAFWGHGEERGRDFKKVELILRTRILSLGDYFFVYTKSGKDFLINNSNFKNEQIFVVNNSTDTEAIASAKLSPNEKPSLSLPFEFSDQSAVTVAAISSLEKSKKITTVLEIHKRMREQIPNFRTLICGEGPERQFLESISGEGVFYLGRVSPHDLAQISKVVIAVVSPGPVGLVVTDSFAMGVPIITSINQNHGPEFSYLKNGYNSVIVQDSPSMYVEAINRVMKETELQKSLQFGLAKSLENFNIDIMTENYLAGLEEILGEVHG